MHLVDDENLVTRQLGQVASHFLQIAHLLDAVVRGTIDLDDVDGLALLNAGAQTAGATRCARGTLRAGEAAGKNAGQGRLADASAAREQKGMGDATRRQGPHQCLHDAVLADHVVKGLGPVFPGEHLIGHRWAMALHGPARKGAAQCNLLVFMTTKTSRSSQLTLIVF